MKKHPVFVERFNRCFLELLDAIINMFTWVPFQIWYSNMGMIYMCYIAKRAIEERLNEK